MKWYKRDPDAALSGMAELTFEECGAYNRLLDLLYSRDGVVPDDDALCAACFHCDPRTWRRLKARLIARGKVRSVDGYLTANGVDETILQAEVMSEIQRKRVGKRWERTKNINKNNGPAIQRGNTNTLTYTDSFFPTAAREPAAPKKEVDRQGKASEILAQIVRAKGWVEDD